MQQNGIKAGAVLELYQAKLDENQKPTRLSNSTVIKVEPWAGVVLIASPSLPPGDVIGKRHPAHRIRSIPIAPDAPAAHADERRAARRSAHHRAQRRRAGVGALRPDSA